MQLIINNDFIFTISSEAKLNGVLFFDYGKGFDDNEAVDFNLRATAGIEARWISPFGPTWTSTGLEACWAKAVTAVGSGSVPPVRFITQMQSRE